MEQPESVTSVTSPQDLINYDIKHEKSPAEADSRSPRKRAILSVLAILMFFVGTMIAPPAIQQGDYTVNINYGSISYEFSIGIVNEITNKSATSIISTGGEVIYNVQYLYASGNIISIQFKPSKIESNIQAKELLAKISSSKESFTFYGQVQDNGSVLYNFRMLTDTSIALGLMFLISFLWLTELVPLAASSLLIPVILVFTKVQSASVALQPFSEPIIFLFLAGFLMAEAMGRTGLDKFISYRLFAVIPPNGKILLFSLMTLSAFFSMFMSNTAAVALLIPLALQLLKGVDVGDQQYRKTVVLGIAYAATIGGIGSIIGTPPNIIAAELLKEFDSNYDISFVEWFMFGLPVVVLMLPVVFAYLWFRFKPKVDPEKLRKAQTHTKLIIHEELQLTKEQMLVSLIFIATMAMWLTTSFHGISASIIAVAAAVALFFVGQVQQSDLNVINWNALLTFGGGLALGGLIIQTGLADYIGTKAINLSGMPILLILFLIALIGLVLTAFASNTASAVIMVPIALPLGYILGISPIVLAILVAIAASVDFAIVIGTPPTMMAYSTGLFEVKEIFNIGIILDLVGLIVITLLSYLLFGVIANFI